MINKTRVLEAMDAALYLMQPEIDRRVAEEKERLLERLREPSEAMCDRGALESAMTRQRPYIPEANAKAIWKAMLSVFEKGQQP